MVLISNQRILSATILYNIIYCTNQLESVNFHMKVHLSLNYYLFIQGVIQRTLNTNNYANALLPQIPPAAKSSRAHFRILLSCTKL